MASEVKPRLISRLKQSFKKDDLLYLVASLLVQMILGLLFGHMYDIRISMATGYLVATGQDPYIPQDLTSIFNNPAFQGMTSIGYPPPWPMILGAIYAIFYVPTHNLLIYNLGIKLPIITANLGLAYLVREVLNETGAKQAVSHKAWLFMLFNPFLLYFTTAWGQFDSLVAWLTLAALVALVRKHTAYSAILLALAIAFKPTPVPVVLVVIAYLWGAPWHKVIRYIATLFLSLVIFCILPFFIFRWDATPIFQGWHAQFSVSGGMTLTTLYELLTDTYNLPGSWWLLGIIWLPAILIGALLLPKGKLELSDLMKNSLVLILIFFLTRTWLSEQNLTLILPLVLVLVSIGELPKITLSAVWILPLIFTVFNTSPAQLLFPILPDMMTKLLQWADNYRAARLLARMLLVIPWQVAGWWIVTHRTREKVAVPA